MQGRKMIGGFTLLRPMRYPISCLLNYRFFNVTPCLQSSVSRLKPLREAVRKQENARENVVEAPKKLTNLPESEIGRLTREYGHPEDWHLIYRLGGMPFAQALSKLKLLMTFSLFAGTPVSIILYWNDVVAKDLCYFLFGASLFSLTTLCLFSFYSTKVVGVLSQHKETGLLRLGLLSFWGSRRNILIHPNQLLPAADLTGGSTKRTVRVGLSGDLLRGQYQSVRPLFISSVTGRVVDKELFEEFVGRVWTSK